MEVKNKTAPWKKFWDSESRTPFAVRGAQLITYDDERSVYEKVKFAMEKNLAGIMVWSVDTDDFQGDCAMTEDNAPLTFPLMRAINKSIVQALEEIQNSISNDKMGLRGGASSKATLTFNVMLGILMCLGYLF